MSTILLVATPLSLASSFESVIGTLRSRGHVVRVTTEGDGSCPATRSDGWRDSILALRGCLDYARYLREPLLGCEKLRKRALFSAIESMSGGTAKRIAAPCPSCRRELKNDDFARMAFGLDAEGLQTVEALFRMTEETVPSDPAYDAFIRAERPDAVIVMPMVRFGSGQADIVKSCRVLGVPVALAVPALDSLSAHGLIHAHPDQVFVWNDTQFNEAVALHRMPPDRITVTGAPRFDTFYDLKPAVSKQEFCAPHGLDAGQPILTYLCSSDFVNRDEAVFVAQWIDEIRRDPQLRECGIVLRPHPRARRTWSQVDVRGWGRVAFIPTSGGNPTPSLHASLCYADAVVALNTTASIEAGILGKPVFTFFAPESAQGQTGTLYFQYLLEQNGGFLEPASDFDAHRRQLTGAVAGDYDAGAIRAFVAGFIRMGNADVPVAARMADSIGRLMTEKR